MFKSCFVKSFLSNNVNQYLVAPALSPNTHRYFRPLHSSDRSIPILFFPLQCALLNNVEKAAKKETYKHQHRKETFLS